MPMLDKLVWTATKFIPFGGAVQFAWEGLRTLSELKFGKFTLGMKTINKIMEKVFFNPHTRGSLDRLGKKLGKLDDAIAVEHVTGLAVQLQRLSSPIIPAILIGLNALLERFNKLTGAARLMTSGMASMLVVLGAAGTALGVAGHLAGGIEQFVAFGRHLPAIASGLQGVMGALQGGAIAAATSPLAGMAAALLAIFVAVEVLTPQINILGAVLSKLAGGLGFVRGLVQGVAGEIWSALEPIRQAIGGTLAAAGINVKDAFAQAGKAFADLQAKGEDLGHIVGQKIVAPFQWGATRVATLWTSTFGRIQSGLTWFLDFARGIGQKLVSVLAENSPGPTAQIREKWTRLTHNIQWLWERLMSAVTLITNAFSRDLTVRSEAFQTIFRGIVFGVQRAVGGAYQAIRAYILEVGRGLAENLNAANLLLLIFSVGPAGFIKGLNRAEALGSQVAKTLEGIPAILAYILPAITALAISTGIVNKAVHGLFQLTKAFADFAAVALGFDPNTFIPTLALKSFLDELEQSVSDITDQFGPFIRGIGQAIALFATISPTPFLNLVPPLVRALANIPKDPLLRSLAKGLAQITLRAVYEGVRGGIILGFKTAKFAVTLLGRALFAGFQVLFPALAQRISTLFGLLGAQIAAVISISQNFPEKLANVVRVLLLALPYGERLVMIFNSALASLQKVLRGAMVVFNAIAGPIKRIFAPLFDVIVPALAQRFGELGQLLLKALKNPVAAYLKSGGFKNLIRGLTPIEILFSSITGQIQKIKSEKIRQLLGFVREGNKIVPPDLNWIDRIRFFGSPVLQILGTLYTSITLLVIAFRALNKASEAGFALALQELYVGLGDWVLRVVESLPLVGKPFGELVRSVASGIQFVRRQLAGINFVIDALAQRVRVIPEDFAAFKASITGLVVPEWAVKLLEILNHVRIILHPIAAGLEAIIRPVTQFFDKIALFVGGALALLFLNMLRLSKGNVFQAIGKTFKAITGAVGFLIKSLTRLSETIGVVGKAFTKEGRKSLEFQTAIKDLRVRTGLVAGYDRENQRQEVDRSRRVIAFERELDAQARNRLRVRREVPLGQLNAFGLSGYSPEQLRRSRQLVEQNPAALRRAAYRTGDESLRQMVEKNRVEALRNVASGRSQREYLDTGQIERQTLEAIIENADIQVAKGKAILNVSDFVENAPQDRIDALSNPAKDLYNSVANESTITPDNRLKLYQEHVSSIERAERELQRYVQNPSNPNNQPSRQTLEKLGEVYNLGPEIPGLTQSAQDKAARLSGLVSNTADSNQVAKQEAAKELLALQQQVFDPFREGVRDLEKSIADYANEADRGAAKQNIFQRSVRGLSNQFDRFFKGIGNRANTALEDFLMGPRALDGKVPPAAVARQRQAVEESLRPRINKDLAQQAREDAQLIDQFFALPGQERHTMGKERLRRIADTIGLFDKKGDSTNLSERELASKIEQRRMDSVEAAKPRLKSIVDFHESGAKGMREGGAEALLSAIGLQKNVGSNTGNLPPGTLDQKTYDKLLGLVQEGNFAAIAANTDLAKHLPKMARFVGMDIEEMLNPDARLRGGAKQKAVGLRARKIDSLREQAGYKSQDEMLSALFGDKAKSAGVSDIGQLRRHYKDLQAGRFDRLPPEVAEMFATTLYKNREFEGGASNSMKAIELERELSSQRLVGGLRPLQRVGYELFGSGAPVDAASGKAYTKERKTFLAEKDAAMRQKDTQRRRGYFTLLKDAGDRDGASVAGLRESYASQYAQTAHGGEYDAALAHYDEYVGRLMKGNVENFSNTVAGFFEANLEYSASELENLHEKGSVSGATWRRTQLTLLARSIRNSQFMYDLEDFYAGVRKKVSKQMKSFFEDRPRAKAFVDSAQNLVGRGRDLVGRGRGLAQQGVNWTRGFKAQYDTQTEFSLQTLMERSKVKGFRDLEGKLQSRAGLSEAEVRAFVENQGGGSLSQRFGSNKAKEIAKIFGISADSQEFKTLNEKYNTEVVKSFSRRLAEELGQHAQKLSQRAVISLGKQFNKGFSYIGKVIAVQAGPETILQRGRFFAGGLHTIADAMQSVRVNYLAGFEPLLNLEKGVRRFADGLRQDAERQAKEIQAQGKQIMKPFRDAKAAFLKMSRRLPDQLTGAVFTLDRAVESSLLSLRSALGKISTENVQSFLESGQRLAVQGLGGAGRFLKENVQNRLPLPLGRVLRKPRQPIYEPGMKQAAGEKLGANVFVDAVDELRFAARNTVASIGDTLIGFSEKVAKVDVGALLQKMTEAPGKIQARWLGMTGEIERYLWFFSNKASDAANAIQERLNETANNVRTRWSNTVSAITGSIFGRWIGKAWRAGRKLLSYLSEASPGPSRETRENWQHTSEVVQGEMDEMANHARGAGERIAGAFGAVNKFLKIGAALGGVAGGMMAISGLFRENNPQLAENLEKWGGILFAVDGVVAGIGAIQQVAGDAFEFLTDDSVMGFFKGAVGKVKSIAGPIGKSFANTFNNSVAPQLQKAKNWFGKGFNETVKPLAKGAAKMFTGTFNDRLKPFGKSVWKNAIAGPATKVAGVVKAQVAGLMTAATAAIGSVVAAMESVVAAAASAATAVKAFAVSTAASAKKAAISATSMIASVARALGGWAISAVSMLGPIAPIVLGVVGALTLISVLITKTNFLGLGDFMAPISRFLVGLSKIVLAVLAVLTWYPVLRVAFMVIRYELQRLTDWIGQFFRRTDDGVKGTNIFAQAIAALINGATWLFEKLVYISEAILGFGEGGRMANAYIRYFVRNTEKAIKVLAILFPWVRDLGSVLFWLLKTAMIPGLAIIGLTITYFRFWGAIINQFLHGSMMPMLKAWAETSWIVGLLVTLYKMSLTFFHSLAAVLGVFYLFKFIAPFLGPIVPIISGLVSGTLALLGALNPIVATILVFLAVFTLLRPAWHSNFLGMRDALISVKNWVDKLRQAMLFMGPWGAYMKEQVDRGAEFIYRGFWGLLNSIKKLMITAALGYVTYLWAIPKAIAAMTSFALDKVEGFFSWLQGNGEAVRDYMAGIMGATYADIAMEKLASVGNLIQRIIDFAQVAVETFSTFWDKLSPTAAFQNSIQSLKDSFGFLGGLRNSLFGGQPEATTPAAPIDTPASPTLFASAQVDTGRTDEKWGMTSEVVQGHMKTIEDASAESGPIVQGNLSEASPGPTYMIRKHWAHTAAFVVGQWLMMQGASSSTLGNITYFDRDRINRDFQMGLRATGEFVAAAAQSLRQLDFNTLGNSARQYGLTMVAIGTDIAGTFARMTTTAALFGFVSLWSMSPLLAIFATLAIGALIIATNFLGIRSILVGLGKVVRGLWTIISSLVKGLLEFAAGVRDMFRGIGQALRGNFTPLIQGAKRAVRGLQMAVQGVKAGAIQAFQGLWQMVQGFGMAIRQVVGFAQVLLRSIGLGIRIEIQRVMNGVSVIGNFLVRAVTHPREVWEDFIDFLRTLPAQMANLARRALQPVLDVANKAIDGLNALRKRVGKAPLPRVSMGPEVSDPSVNPRRSRQGGVAQDQINNLGGQSWRKSRGEQKADARAKLAGAADAMHTMTFSVGMLVPGLGQILFLTSGLMDAFMGLGRIAGPVFSSIQKRGIGRTAILMKRKLRMQISLLKRAFPGLAKVIDPIGDALNKVGSVGKMVFASIQKRGLKKTGVLVQRLLGRKLTLLGKKFPWIAKAATAMGGILGPVFAAAAAALAPLWAALAPILPILLAIAGAVALVGLAWKFNIFGIGDILGSLWSVIRGFFDWVKNDILASVGMVFGEVGNQFRLIGDSLAAVFEPIQPLLRMLGIGGGGKGGVLKLALMSVFWPLIGAIKIVLLQVRLVAWVLVGIIKVVGLLIRGFIGAGAIIVRAIVSPFVTLYRVVQGVFAIFRGIRDLMLGLGKLILNTLLLPFRQLLQAIQNTPLIGRFFVGSDRRRQKNAGYARGGLVRGAGSGSSDSISAPWLSNGEFVMPTRQTMMIGGFLEAVRRGVPLEQALELLPVSRPSLPSIDELSSSGLGRGGGSGGTGPAVVEVGNVTLKIENINISGVENGQQAAEEFLENIDPLLRRKLKEMLRDMVEISRA